MASLSRTLACVLAISSLAACGGDGGGTGPGGGDGTEPRVSSVTVSPAEVTVAVEETTSLQATVRDQDGDAMDVAVSWASSDTDVAEVNDEGIVTGRAAGDATISATADGVSGTAEVTVEDDRTATERAIDEAEDVVDRLIPDGVPGGDRDPLEELEAVAEGLLELEGILAVRTYPVGLTAQAVTEDGTSILFIHNRFEPATDGSAAHAHDIPRPAPSAGTARWTAPPRRASRTVGRGPAASPAGSKDAIVVAIDGGGSVAREVEGMLEGKGYDVLYPLGTLADFQNFSDLGALHLDTHGSLFLEAELITNAEGEKGARFGAKRYAVQTATVIEGDLEALRQPLEDGEVVVSVKKDADGTVRSKLAITEKFVARHWSFDGGVVVLHACLGGAEPFNPGGSCRGACESGEPGVLDPGLLRQAILDAGADVVMSFDNYTNTNEARPSILYFWDRLLGADEFRPEDPPLRPFTGEKVVEGMQREGLDHFDRPTYILGVQVGTDYTVNVTFDGELPRTQLAPTVREMDVVDDAAEPTGELTLFGRFGTEPGTVEVGGAEVPVEAWDDGEILARPPFEATGDVVVKAPSGIESNEVPLTKWEGQLELQFDPNEGSLLATAVMDVVFRGDVHPYRTAISADPRDQHAKAYVSPASEGTAKGQGEHTSGNTTTTWYGERSLQVISKQTVDQGGGGIDAMGGYLELDPGGGTGRMCIHLVGRFIERIESPSGTREEELPLLFMPEDLWTGEGILGCVDVSVGDDYTVQGGSHTHEDGDLRWDFSWTALQPTAAPDEETAG